MERNIHHDDLFSSVVETCSSPQAPDWPEITCLSVFTMLQVKRVIIELYNDTSQRHSTAVVKMIRNAVINVLYVNVDIWQSKVSGEKFIGECWLSVLGGNCVQNLRL